MHTAPSASLLSLSGGFFRRREWLGRRYLISPFWDGMLAGGMAYLFLGVLFLAYPLEVALEEPQMLLFTGIFAYLAFMINDPHFISSYQIFYSGFDEKLRRFKEKRLLWWRYINAAFIVPFLMLTYFFYVFFTGDMRYIGTAAFALFFFVGWHYVKQSFGVFIMLSALKTFYFTKGRRYVLLANCYAVWIYTWLEGNIAIAGIARGSAEFWGVKYQSLAVPMPYEVVQVSLWAACVLGVLSLWAVASQAWLNKRPPSFSGLLGYTSMYPMLMFSWVHPLWLYAIPMFHSLQYLLFIYAYKRNQYRLKIKENEVDEEARQEARKHVLQFIGVALILALVLFHGIPYSLEGVLKEQGILLPLMFAFTIFLNVHHYFIDNVIWRKEHEEVGKYLFYRD